MSPPSAVRDAYRDWFGSFDAQLAFTGSVRQCVQEGVLVEWVSTEAVAKNVAYVMRRLSRRILGRAACRAGCGLLYAGVVEGEPRSDFKRMHVHLAIGGVPATCSLGDVRNALLDQWRSSRWGYLDNHMQELATDTERRRWNTYTMKEFRPDISERWFTNFRR